ncbi:MAG: tRNA lysidine(34) synthetase TilS [Deltaproteobacteria bacterium]|nr:MAG: tRNA lysidine(34) synthetase TilS [Deltaproteobacteria bacterium]
MKRIERVFLSTADKYGMFEHGDSVLVALSGGPDSVCLLHLLIRFRKRLGIEQLLAAHVNYGTRGRESDEDEEFVRNLANYLDAPLFVKRVRKRDLGRQNFQDAARRIRYDFFREVALREGAGKIATAHTKTDQAETVLMRVLSGAGVTGLKGIPPVSEGGIVRPLIEVTRREVQEFLESEGISYRVDRTNLEGLYERNRIRNEVIPLLKEVTGRDVEATLADLGDLFRQVQTAVSEMAEGARRKGVVREDSVDVGKYRALPELVRKFLLQEILREATGKEPSRRLLDRVDELLVRDFPSFQYSLTPDLVLVRSYGEAFVKRADEVSADYEEEIPGPGRYPLPEAGGELVIQESEKDSMKRILSRIVRDRYVAAFEWTSDFFPLRVRNFRPGDRVVPFGRKSEKKLKSIFIERKIPLQVRKVIPVVFSGDRLIWVPGVVRSSHLPLTAGTEKIIVLEYRRV